MPSSQKYRMVVASKPKRMHCVLSKAIYKSQHKALTFVVPPSIKYHQEEVATKCEPAYSAEKSFIPIMCRDDIKNPNGFGCLFVRHASGNQMFGVARIIHDWNFFTRKVLTAEEATPEGYEAIPEPVTLSEDEKLEFIGTSSFYDFDNAVFKDWSATHNLVYDKQDDPIDFVKKVLTAMGKTLTYSSEHKYRMQKCSQSIQIGKGDCGSHSCLLVAACRANRIPARSLFGMLCAEGVEASELQAHVMPEVFIDGIGWILIEATLYENGFNIGTPFLAKHFDTGLDLSFSHSEIFKKLDTHGNLDISYLDALAPKGELELQMSPKHNVSNKHHAVIHKFLHSLDGDAFELFSPALKAVFKNSKEELAKIMMQPEYDIFVDEEEMLFNEDLSGFILKCTFKKKRSLVEAEIDKFKTQALQFVDKISTGDYDTTWNQLSENFKNHFKSHEKFKEWIMPSHQLKLEQEISPVFKVETHTICIRLPVLVLSEPYILILWFLHSGEICAGLLESREPQHLIQEEIHLPQVKLRYVLWANQDSITALYCLAPNANEFPETRVLLNDTTITCLQVLYDAPLRDANRIPLEHKHCWFINA